MVSRIEATDFVQTFQIEQSHLRGRLVGLGSVIDTVLAKKPYPIPVATLLGETILVATVLASALKYDGIFTLQTRGDGPVKTMAVDITSDGEIRGIAKYNEAAIPLGLDTALVPALIGAGHIAFTVDQGPYTERYQGIVALEGERIADCAEGYFAQSEQVETGLRLAVGRVDGHWRGGALVLQRLPDAQAIRLGSNREDDWRRALILMRSATEAELLDPGLSAEALLLRLFHEDGVRTYDARPLQFGCRCGFDRVERIVASLSDEEIAEFRADGPLTVTCEFCNQTYEVDDDALSRIRSVPPAHVLERFDGAAAD